MCRHLAERKYTLTLTYKENLLCLSIYKLYKFIIHLTRVDFLHVNMKVTLPINLTGSIGHNLFSKTWCPF